MMRWLALLGFVGSAAAAETAPDAEAFLSALNCYDGLELADDIMWARRPETPERRMAYDFVLGFGMTHFPDAAVPYEAFGRAMGNILWECRGNPALSFMDAARQAAQFHAENPG